MIRLRTFPIAILALLVSSGVVAAVNLPTAASSGLTIASEHAGKTLPAVPTTTGLSLAPKADATEDLAAPADLPDAANHGATVSAVARAEDATPDTNHGADVSAVAKQNAGQAIAAERRPAGAGKPDDAGKPAGAGPAAPGGAGRP
jgi:hypothetical protein